MIADNNLRSASEYFFFFSSFFSAFFSFALTSAFLSESSALAFFTSLASLSSDFFSILFVSLLSSSVCS